MTTPSELRGCQDEELDERLVAARKELFNLRFQLATGRLDDVARIPALRHEIARILTIQRAREIGLAEQLERAEPVLAAVARPAAIASDEGSDDDGASTEVEP